MISYVCKAYTGLPDFGIRDCGGWPGLKKVIRLELDAEGRSVLGIIADANGDLLGKWREISAEVHSASVEVAHLPEEPACGGTVMDGSPRVGVWLMPDNHSDGELEDFVAGMILDADPIWPLARRYIDTIPREYRKFSTHHTTKAQVYAWTAALRSPGGLLSAATERSPLDRTSEHARCLVDWIRALFDDGHDFNGSP